MSGARILLLYRPRLPGQRAQTIQVLHAAQALAARGHRVTLLADREGPTSPEDALGELGLPPTPGLDLQISPWRHKTPAGLWFRWRLREWWQGPPGLVLARDAPRLLEAIRRWGKAGHRLVYEAHGLDSALEVEAGRDPRPAEQIEQAVLQHADALVANCGGTLRCWQERWAQLPPHRVVHNATSPGRLRGAVAQAEPLLRCAGSLRSFKDPALLVQAAPALALPLQLYGGDPDEQAALGALPAGVELRPPVPYPAVPDLLAHARALLLPLGDNLFGRRLTSPLKLWDYLATAVPIVAPDLPTVREALELAASSAHLYRPGDPAALVRAVAEALAAPPRVPALRSWDQRAAEIEGLILPLLARPA
jgi:glycosyltransferase involved in cell wall biosynthesis